MYTCVKSCVQIICIMIHVFSNLSKKTIKIVVFLLKRKGTLPKQLWCKIIKSQKSWVICCNRQVSIFINKKFLFQCALFVLRQRQHTYIQPLSSGIILCWYCLYSCLLPNVAIFTFPFPMLNKSFIAKPLSCYQRRMIENVQSQYLGLFPNLQANINPFSFLNHYC